LGLRWQTMYGKGQYCNRTVMEQSDEHNPQTVLSLKASKPGGQWIMTQQSLVPLKASISQENSAVRLQRKCACEESGTACARCENKATGLQRKLTIGSSNDPLEQEADRVADQVLATPTNPAVSGATPSIQRYTGQPSEQPEEVPVSVDRVLGSSGKPLDIPLRKDMESRFGHDFSQVRVHSNDAGEQSARDVNANAYTVGHNIVFGAGQFAPMTHDGRRLIAHELTHVVQQSNSDGIRVGQINSKRDLSPIAVQPAGVARIQRQSAKPGADRGAGIPEIAARVSRAEAAVKLLRRLYDRYKSNSKDKEVHDKYLVTILQFLEETVTDARMRKTFASLEVNEQRTARQECEDALYYVKRLEIAFRTGYPRLDDDRTWKSPIGAMDMAQRYLDQIVNYREPIPLVPGWHKVVDENGVILGYLHLLVGVTSIYDVNGKYVGGDELGLERPLIDPIDIAAGGIAGLVRGPLRSALSALARGAAPRMRVAGFLVSQGLKSSVPVLAGEVAPSAFVMAETLAAESVPGLARGASGTAAKAAVSQGARVETASVIETATTQGATSVPAQGVAAAASPGVVSAASPGTQSVAGAVGATVASNVTAQQMDPRHARGYGGEQTMGFHHYSQKDGWEFIQGPSGSQGHSVTGSGFDGMAYNQKHDLLDLVDNKSLNRAGNVSSATAIDPAKNLAQNLDDAITQLTGMSNVPNRIRILELLRAKRAALAAGNPGPPNVRLVVTHEGGRTTGVSGPLTGRGVISR
jgi:hypothetical protein